MAEPAQVHLGSCEVDVFEGFGVCDQPGVIVYEEDTGVVLLCVGHAKQLGADVEFGPESDD